MVITRVMMMMMMMNMNMMMKMTMVIDRPSSSCSSSLLFFIPFQLCCWTQLEMQRMCCVVCHDNCW